MRFIFFIIFVFSSLFFRAQNGFVENKGQWPKEVLFAVDIQEGKLFIQRDGFRIHQWDLSGWHHASNFEVTDVNAIRTKGHVYDVRWQSTNGSSFSMGN
jgi:hypothetical protein